MEQGQEEKVLEQDEVMVTADLIPQKLNNMRPKKHRNIQFDPNVVFFKPQGIPLRTLEVVDLLHEEIQAIKYYYVDELSQTESSEKMNISQPTFARILNSANKKISSALVTGKAIKILVDNRDS